MSQDDRHLLQEIIRQEHERSHPRMPVDKYFEIFSAEQILKARSFDLDADQIQSGVLGGGDDGGVDSFFLFANRKLVREDSDLSELKGQQVAFDLFVIQSKGGNSGFSESALMKLSDFAENCLRPTATAAASASTLYSDALRAAVHRFHESYQAALTQRPTLSITFYYATLGEQIHAKVQERRDHLVQRISSFFSTAKCECELVGAKALLSWFYKTPTKTIPLVTVRSMPWTGFGKSYLTLVSLSRFFDFVTLDGQLRGEIFEANVRDYQGDVQVNRDISATLAVSGIEEFWWLNNGITILASEVVTSGDVISVTDPLIVNGLQTTYEIYKHFSSVGMREDTRTILVRIIQSNDQQSGDRIIKATNSQTKIPRVWLHATEDIHRKIESLLAGVDLYYDRRKNYYRNRGIQSNKIVTIPYLAQALAAIVLQRPEDARARPTTVAERYYKKLFAEDHPPDLYSRCALAMKRTDEFLDGVQHERGVRLNIVFFLAMYAVCTALKSPKPQRPRIATLDVAMLTDELFENCRLKVMRAYEAAGGDDRAAKTVQLTDALKKELRERFAPKRSKR